MSSSTTYRGQTKVLAGVLVFMYIVATIHLAVKWFYVREAFIKYGLGSGETSLLSLTDWLVTGPLWVRVIRGVAIGSNILTADSIMVCLLPDFQGCNDIYIRFGGAGSSGKGAGGSSSFPVYSHYVELVSLTVGCMNSCHSPISVFGAFCFHQLLILSTNSERNGYYQIWEMPYFIMALPTMIICTMLIVYRLTRAGRTGKTLNFRTSLYYKIIEILIESSTLYVVALVVNIPLLATNSPYSAYPQAVLDSVTVSSRNFC